MKFQYVYSLFNFIPGNPRKLMPRNFKLHLYVSFKEVHTFRKYTL